MGWLLKTKEEEGKETKYKIWTTVSDGWITEEWMTRDEIIKFLFWNKLYDFMDKFIEDSMTFPNGYHDKDTHKRNWDDKLADEHYKFTKSTFGVKGINYVKLKSNKFSEILNANGIRVTIEDARGYSFDSKEGEASETVELKDMFEFTKWFEERYTLIESKKLKKCAYVDSITNDILIHGSDEHFTELIKNHGKTIEECYEIYKAKNNG